MPKPLGNAKFSKPRKSLSIFTMIIENHSTTLHRLTIVVTSQIYTNLIELIPISAN